MKTSLNNFQPCIKEIECGTLRYVGVRDFINCPSPSNILLINNLHGITLKSASMVANTDYTSGIDFLNELIKVAHLKVIQKFGQIVQDKFTYNSVLDGVMIDRFKSTTNAPLNANRGLLIQTPRSKNLKALINTVIIKVVEAGAVTINIIDGEKTTTKTATLVANVSNTVKLDYLAETENVYITIDNTALTTYQGEIVYSSTPSGCSTCNGGSSNKNILVYGWDGTQKTNTMFGVGADVSLVCNTENVVCSLIGRMNFLIWYQCGVDFMKEILTTDRLNAVTEFNRENALMLLEDYQKEYDKEAKVFTNSIDMYIKNVASDCFTCNKMKTMIYLP